MEVFQSQNVRDLDLGGGSIRVCIRKSSAGYKFKMWAYYCLEVTGQ